MSLLNNGNSSPSNENESPNSTATGSGAKTRAEEIAEVGKIVKEKLDQVFLGDCPKDFMLDMLPEDNFYNAPVSKNLYNEAIGELLKNEEIVQHTDNRYSPPKVLLESKLPRWKRGLNRDPPPPKPEPKYSRAALVEELCKEIMKKIKGTTYHHYTRTLLSQLKRENDNLQLEENEYIQRDIFNEALRSLTHDHKIIRERSTITVRPSGMAAPNRRQWVVGNGPGAGMSRKAYMRWLAEQT